MPRKRVPSRTAGTASAQKLHRRVHERAGESRSGDSRPAGGLSLAEGLAQHRPQETRGSGSHRAVQRRNRQGLPELLEQDAALADAVGHGVVRAGQGETEPRKIVPYPSIGHAPPGVEEPPRQSAGARPQAPSLAGAQIQEWKTRRNRSHQLVGGADVREIAHGGSVAGQQQMVAVVDGAIEPGIEIGPAAAAGLAAGLVEDDGMPRPRQRYRHGKAGHAGADDVCSGHEEKASVLTSNYAYEDAQEFLLSARRDDEQWRAPREEEQRSRRQKGPADSYA